MTNILALLQRLILATSLIDHIPQTSATSTRWSEPSPARILLIWGINGPGNQSRGLRHMPSIQLELHHVLLRLFSIPRVDVDLDALYSRMRFEFGSSAGDSESVEENIAMCDKDYEDYTVEIARLESQVVFLRAQQKQTRH
ncbi:hypothetical protein D9757_006896 [Collybiopsis confluens]|uniref:Uncharacterized protein n=1 Tax=Collybiopsis confluens TaxID=2823264 RepID=A0A8H5HPV3_9AGAR|nr:hypothetical protein D9757_006896 [Collybiopsis confluens]